MGRGSNRSSPWYGSTSSKNMGFWSQLGIKYSMKEMNYSLFQYHYTDHLLFILIFTITILPIFTIFYIILLFDFGETEFAF